MEGQKIAHYEILRKLGAGGMGEVFEARDTRLGRTVALKVLPRDVAQDSRRLRRFFQEARIASQLSHANITHLYEIQEENGVVYLTMEFVEGETLEARLKDGPIPAVEAIRIILQVAAGLEEAHKKGITHRDIKPANIMITKTGDVKILDFGLAKMFTNSSDADTHTETGAILGTVQYMSPEQALGEEVDGRSDLFSLGIVMYEMLSGRRPFSGAGPKGTLNQIITAAPGPIALPESPAYSELLLVLTKCLRKEREERYQSARDIAADLSRVQRFLSSGKLSGEDLPAPLTDFHISRNTARTLFVILQFVYLLMYMSALRWADGMQSGLSHVLGNSIGNIAFWTLTGVAVAGIAVRLYLISSVALDHVETGMRYRKAFPIFFLLDELWCLAPFGLSLRMSELLTMACVPPLAFCPFSQRTLIRGAYDLYSPHRCGSQDK